jgi:hypothetical protein
MAGFWRTRERANTTETRILFDWRTRLSEPNGFAGPPQRLVVLSTSRVTSNLFGFRFGRVYAEFEKVMASLRPHRSELE